MVFRTFKLSLLYACYWVSSCMIYSYAERFLLHYGFRTDEIGISVAIAYLAAMIVQPALAQAADRERAVTLRSGICICALVAIALAASTVLSTRVLPLLAVLFGAMTCVTLAAQPLINAVGFHYINRGDEIDFSFARGAASVAYALSSLLLGYLASKNIDSILWVYVAANAGMFLIALRFAPHRNGLAIRKTPENVFSAMRRYPRLTLFCAGMLILNVPHLFINSYLASISQVTGGNMSVMIALAAVVEFPAMMAYSHLRKRISDRVLLLVSASMYLVKTGLLLLAAVLKTATWIVYLSFLMQMFCYAIFVPASSFFANDAVSEQDQVKGQMLLTETGLFSGMISMLLGGLSLQHFGVTYSLLLCEGFILCGVALIALAVRRRKTV